MPADPRRVKELFVAALDLADPGDRGAFLDRECGADADLRHRLGVLLRAHDHPEPALEQPLAGPAEPFTRSHHPEGSTELAGTVVAGRYKLLEPIGEGGMGAVWVADQLEPIKRRVAMKLIKPGMDSRAVLARFEAERQALALMDHPNIAKVLDAGTTDDGRPYFVMELVKGTPITQFCDARKLTTRERLELFVPVCQAIQHAHQKGIIHRDVKPSNVLVALHDEKAVPKVIDFGVAKATGTPLTEKTLHTGFEQVVGTPAYMSPEQATFNQLDIDTRSDVYSLGVLLYELLTGTTPIERERFKKAAILEMLRVVREEEAPRPSTRLSSTAGRASIAAVRGAEPGRLSQELRGELDWIALKALEKDRARRYDTPTALARDVQRYLADEVVEARPPSAGYRLKKFARRHKGRVTAAAVIVLALIGGAIGTTYGVIEVGNRKDANALREQAERDREAAETARGTAETARDGERHARVAADSARNDLARAQEKLARIEYGRTMQVAYQEWREGNVARARALLESTRPDLRGWEWKYATRLCHADLLTLSGHTGPVWSASYSTDGSRIVTASEDKTAKVWDANTGAEILTLKGHTGTVHVATFSRDGSRIVTGSWDKTAKIWDAKTGHLLLTIPGFADDIRTASFSPDGSRVLVGRVCDAKTGDELLKLSPTGSVTWALFSPDGLRILMPGKVCDAKTGAELVTFKGHTKRIYGAHFNTDGTQVVTWSADGTVKVWDATTGKMLLNLGQAGAVSSASFGPDGTRVVTGSGNFDQLAKLWGAKTGAELGTFKGHTGYISSVAFSPDGSRVLTASSDHTAKVWDAKAEPDALTINTLINHYDLFYTASFSADGTRVVTGREDGRLKVWDAKTGAELLTLKGHTRYLTSTSFSTDGSRILTGSEDKTAKVWNAATGTEVLTLNGHTGWVTSASFSADGTRVVTSSDDYTAKVWDAKTGAELLTLEGKSGIVGSVSFSPDGSRVVIGYLNRTTKVWDARTGAELFTLRGHTSSVYSVAYSPDGLRVVTGSADKTAKVWDANTGTEIMTLTGHVGTVKSVSFNADGSRILTGGDKTAKVWDATTGAELFTLRGHELGVFSSAFSADGTRVMTGSGEAVKVWDARPVNRAFLPREPAPPPREVKW